ncbi:hypothetical protein [Herbaspirillum sp. RV1423]|uniref:hypothetical protein n=1 Tax=Herbaspirillum sp. RV1423 TaxID=1443993 RepID=UPI0004B800A0|nr:hypothetical protein [Herbaspirillum sp. RV1423]
MTVTGKNMHHLGFSLEEAYLHAQHARPNRRALITLIQDDGSYWWGGNINKLRPQSSVFPSPAAAEEYRQLVKRFRHGQAAKAHMLLVHGDGAFGAIMLGMESKEEALAWLHDTVRALRQPMVEMIEASNALEVVN